MTSTRYLTALFAALLLLAACGSSSNGKTSAAAGAGQSTSARQAIRYARCMRANGVPNFPDPNPNGGFPGISGMQNNPQYQTAQGKCRAVAPGAGQHGINPANPTVQNELLALAKCMRTNGVPKFPDPGGDFSQFQAAVTQLEQTSPNFTTALTKCQKLVPGLSHGG